MYKKYNFNKIHESIILNIINNINDGKYIIDYIDDEYIKDVYENVKTGYYNFFNKLNMIDLQYINNKLLLCSLIQIHNNYKSIKI